MGNHTAGAGIGNIVFPNDQTGVLDIALNVVICGDLKGQVTSAGHILVKGDITGAANAVGEVYQNLDHPIPPLPQTIPKHVHSSLDRNCL